MISQNTAEVHFHQQEQLSVFVQSTDSGRHEKIGEIGLVCFYATRMIVNFGNSETAYNLSRSLSIIGPAIPLFASGAEDGGFELINYPGHTGRYYFLASIDWTGNGHKFSFKPKGFGLFAKGMAYYGPVSLFGLVRHLAQKRADDAVFHHALATALVHCGILGVNGSVTLPTQANASLQAMGLGAGVIEDADYLS